MTESVEKAAPREVTASMYQPRAARDRLTIRRAAYGEFAIQQEGEGRSVYLSRLAVVRLAFRLLREVARPLPPTQAAP